METRSAKLYSDGTDFTLAILSGNADRYYVRTSISVENEYTKYYDEGEYLSWQDLDEWITTAFRLLAGAYRREYSLTFERAGIAVDFYPYTQDGKEVSRSERRNNDCVMAIRMLMRSADKKRFLGGVHTYLAHRKEIGEFALRLRSIYDGIWGERVHGTGEFHFVGVSPLGYRHCSYWYLDESKQAQAEDFVWVKMGSHDTEQIVRVDRVLRCDEKSAPFPPSRVKRVLKMASEEERNALQE